MNFFCQSAEARIAFGIALNALINAQHQQEILLKIIFGFGQLFVGEMGIQVADGWGGFLFHPLTLAPRWRYRRQQDLPKAAKPAAKAPAKKRTMSAAAKAKLSAAAKARWAKIKAAGKKSL